MRNAISIITCCLVINVQGQSLKQLFDQSMDMYKAKEYESFESLTEQALTLHPSHPTLWYHLAAAKALNGKSEESFRALENLLFWNPKLDYDSDTDFENLLSSVGYRDSLATYAQRFASVKEHSTVYAHLEGKYHAEDLVLKGETIYFTDIRNGLVMAYETTTQSYRQIAKLKGSAFAIASMDKNQTVWTTSSMIPNYKDYREEDHGDSWVYEIDLSEGRILTEIHIPEKGILGDMAISRAGKLYITNSLKPEIFVIDIKGKTLEGTIPIEDGFSLQGIDISDDQKHVFVADYIKGIVKIDLHDPKDRSWLVSHTYLLKGIDGLTFVDKQHLLAIQNGSKVKRVILLELEGTLVKDLDLLDNGLHPEADPTNGMRSDGNFYYISNSPWPLYKNEREALLDLWPPTEIRRIHITTGDKKRK